MSEGRGDWSVRIYRLLLRVYPAELRATCGGEMEQLFRDRLREPSARGVRGRVTVWRQTLGDFVRSVPREHWHARRRGRRPAHHRRTFAGSVVDDLRCALRSLRRHAGFTALAAAIVAVAIGAATAIFTLVHATLLRPPPYPDPDRLVVIWERNPGESAGTEGPSPANFIDWRAASSAFSGMAAWREHPVILYGTVTAEQTTIARVTADFFSVMGVEPLLGRTFEPDEIDRARYDAAERYIGGGNLAVVVSHRLWVRRFGSNRGVVGRVIETELGPAEVVGVMPPGFGMPSPDVQLWTPVRFQPEQSQRNARFLDVVGRLRQTVTLQQAQREMDVIAAELARRYPASNAGWGVQLVRLHDALVGGARRSLVVLFGAVVCVLLVACANVAGMQLARAAVKGHEMALRVALGASRGRLIRQVLTENIALAAGGGLVGIALAFPLLEGLAALRPPTMGGARVSIHLGALAFAAFASIVTGLVVGIAPAMRASHLRAAAPLKSGGRGSTTSRRDQVGRRALVIAEVAAAITLLVAASLMIRSFSAVRRVDPGFDPEHVIVFQMYLDKDRYGWSGERHPRDYYRRLTEHLASLPYVEAVGAVTSLPMQPANTVDFSRPYWRVGEPPPEGSIQQADVRLVTPGYFEAMGMPLLRGRAVTVADGPRAAPVAVINETLARTVFGGRDPVGRPLMIDYRGIRPVEVVGVVTDIRFYGLRDAPRAELYFPHAQIPYLALSVAVRTTGNPASYASALEAAVLDVDPFQPVRRIVTLSGLVDRSVAQERFSAWLLGILAGVAVVLAATGIYGVMAYLVAQRTREIGVRMALGARPRKVLGMVLVQSLQLAVTGGVLGTMVALVMSRTMSGLLFGVSAGDPLTFGVVAAGVAGVAAVAGYLPARRAARVDPLLAMRAE